MPQMPDSFWADTMPDVIMSEEDIDALAVLSKNHKVVTLVVPPEIPSELIKRIIAWSNFCLDVGIAPPTFFPMRKKGDSLVCPYCGCPATFKLEMHARDCEWLLAIGRWASTMVQIKEEEEEESEWRNRLGKGMVGS